MTYYAIYKTDMTNIQFKIQNFSNWFGDGPFLLWARQLSLWGVFYKNTNPTHEGCTLINLSPYLLILATWLIVEISAFEFWGDTLRP